MASSPPGSAAKLVDRALGICLKPGTTFRDIEREKAGFTSLYRDYVLWLAALAPVVKLGAFLPGWTRTDEPLLSSLSRTLSGLFLGYVLALAGVYVLALAVNALAPLFGGERDEDRALRLCTYALTPSFLASAAAALPGLGFASALGLYSIALIMVGLPRLMRCDERRVLGYAASAAVAMAAIAYATSLLMSSVLPQW